MATTIPCSVDTTPMAAEIQSVSNHVKGTTAAVVTMQSAVIAAENSSANKVCSNVNRGFFTLIQSQISQKIANKQSRVEALLMHLAQQKRLLMGIKNNMEREYGRLSARYLKIFTSINKELENRIIQVDRPVFDFVNKHMVTAGNRMNALTSWATTTQSESVTTSQQILVSNMKKNARTALEQSSDFLAQIGEQRTLTKKVLISNAEGNDNHDCQIPVAICEMVSDTSGISMTEITTPDNLAPAYSSQIYNSIRESETLPWTHKEEKKQVAEEFHKLLETSNASSRVKKMLADLYSKANYETL